MEKGMEKVNYMIVTIFCYTKEKNLNGILDGKVKQYNREGYLLFHGEYKNGKPWNIKGYEKNNIAFELKEGKGFLKEYDESYRSFFESEYLNGMRNGKGKEYFLGKLAFKGKYKDGENWNRRQFGYFGDIKCYFKNGRKYTKDGKEFEEDLLKVIETIFEGENINGRKIGKFYNYLEELIFEGEQLYDHMIKGKLYEDEKLKYEGDYLFDKIWNGKGYDKNGHVIIDLHNDSGKFEERDEYDNLIKENT